jgi:hypothetical protein
MARSSAVSASPAMAMSKMRQGAHEAPSSRPPKYAGLSSASRIVMILRSRVTARRSGQEDWQNARRAG